MALEKAFGVFTWDGRRLVSGLLTESNADLLIEEVNATVKDRFYTYKEEVSEDQEGPKLPFLSYDEAYQQWAEDYITSKYM